MEYRMILWRMCVSNLGLPWMSNRKIDQILFLFREKKPSYLSSKYRIYQIARILKLRILIFFHFHGEIFKDQAKKTPTNCPKTKRSVNNFRKRWPKLNFMNSMCDTKYRSMDENGCEPYGCKCSVPSKVSIWWRPRLGDSGDSEYREVRIGISLQFDIKKRIFSYIFDKEVFFPLQHRLVRGFSHSILNKYSSFKNQIFERKNFKRKKLLELSQSRILTRKIKTSRSSLFFVTPRGLVDLVPKMINFYQNCLFSSHF